MAFMLYLWGLGSCDTEPYVSSKLYNLHLGCVKIVYLLRTLRGWQNLRMVSNIITFYLYKWTLKIKCIVKSWHLSKWKFNLEIVTGHFWNERWDLRVKTKDFYFFHNFLFPNAALGKTGAYYVRYWILTSLWYYVFLFL